MCIQSLTVGILRPFNQCWTVGILPFAPTLDGGSFYPVTRCSGGCCCSHSKQRSLSPSSARQGKANFAVGPTGRTVGRAIITVQNYGRSFKVAIPGATSWHTGQLDQNRCRALFMCMYMFMFLYVQYTIFLMCIS